MDGNIGQAGKEEMFQDREGEPMEYKKLWTDMHSNIHHDQMAELPLWYDQIKKEMDFWPIAYYPFIMRPTPSGLAVEDRLEDELTGPDWEMVRELARRAEKEGFPMFMGYEWQGSGLDGTTISFSWTMTKTRNIPTGIRSWWKGSGVRRS